MLTKTTYTKIKDAFSFNTSLFKQFTMLLCFGLIGLVSTAQETVIILDQPGSGTFVAPCGVTKIFVEAWGAGSAGGGSSNSNRGGQRGNAGDYSSIEYNLVEEGLTFSYTIGEGGKGVVGTNGGQSSDRTIMQGGKNNAFYIGVNQANNGGQIAYGDQAAEDGEDAANDADGISIGAGGLGNDAGDGYDGGPGAGGGGGTQVNGAPAKGGDGGDGYIRITMTYGNNNSTQYCLTEFQTIEAITHVNFAGIDYASNTTSSQENELFCTQVGTVVQGSDNNEITIKGNTNGNYKNYYVAYIDWNQDGDFNDSNEKYDIGENENSTGIDSENASGNINVPSIAKLGTTTMRIIKTGEDDGYANGACNEYQKGQAEDYTLVVKEFAEKEASCKTWVGDNGIGWFVSSNWEPKGIPTANDCVIINTLNGNSNPKIKGYETTGNSNGIAYAKSITILGDYSQLTLSVQAELQVTEFISSNSPIYITDGSSLIMEDGYLESSANGTIEDNSLLTVKNFSLTSTNASWDINDTSVLIIDETLSLDGDITLNENASLIQSSEDTNLSSGTFTMNRTSTTAHNTDYTYWSSPVQNFNIDNISTTSYRYEWLPTIDNKYGKWSKVSNTNMTVGKGYIIRGENYTASFQNNKPNNGTINTTITRGTYNGSDYIDISSTAVTKLDDNWNLIGNPYPSAINADDFLTENSDSLDTGSSVGTIEGGIRIWTHASELSSGNDTPFYANESASYNADDYITYTLAGSSPSGFDGYIASGQGFFVLMKHAASTPNTVTFTNDMRSYTSEYSNSDFYRTSNTKNRIWLDLIDSEEISSNMLLGYFDDASDAKDPLYDAVIMNSDNTCIYSIIEDEAFVIQGKANPFLETDKVALGLISTKEDVFTIGINKVDGVFETDQDIYLEDTYTNVVHDLRNSPYQFTTEAGTFNDRFILRYQDKSLSVDDVIADSEFRIIATKNFIKASTTTNTINDIVIFDVLGRVIYQANKLNTSEVKLDQLKPTNSPLIVKATLTNGTTKTQKIIY
ncbi:T9SS sorting signal type C domain-containing protein [Formosa sediminum]|uniref:T9SS sorting signal type C domain-containing protein n=1 Tax=Formosa sediminum TaxID=2594004 RepID=A0A516GMX3_9FLAO|nr:GEVED domain-containing protein [Formosa sediminum]QDO92730.1 T9SS sorting signal type C domain-containing protein [Formosa sediminum]